MTKVTFIAWIDYHRRSELLAQHLGAKMHFIHFEPSCRVLWTPIRYVVQAIRTWRILCKDRPRVVFVQNPPIFCALIVFLYGRRYGSQFVIDSHTGAFLSSKWRWSIGIHRRLSQNALATIVHNVSQEKIVQAWGCQYLVIGFTPGAYPPGKPFALDSRYNVAVVSSFHEDEPLGVMFDAAALLPKVRFYVTGDATRIPRPMLSKKPDNCVLTGYLSYEHYVGLLRGVDAIMVLTTGSHALLMGAFEAVSLGRPLIVSDWPILRDYFPKGTVHVPNSVEGICDGVCRAQHEQVMLQRDILSLRDQLEVQWAQQLSALRGLLETCS